MEKEILVEGKRIVYFEEGEGFPFLIIHGWGPWYGPPYVKFRELLASHGYRVIFVNLPGFGLSNGPSPRWGMDDFLKYILGFIEQMNLEKFYLMGHSMGGAMVIKLAAFYPEKIEAPILLSPGIFRPFRIFNRDITRLIINGIYGYFLVLKFLKGLLFFLFAILKILSRYSIKLNWFKKVKNWLDKFIPHYQFVFKEERLMGKILKNIAGIENTKSYLPLIKHPTLIIWGEKDPLFHINAPSLGCIPNHDFKIIPEARHNPQEDAPEKVVELIVNFIKKLETSPK